MSAVILIVSCAHAETLPLISAKYRHSNNGESIYVGPALLGEGVPGVSGTQWNDIDDAGHNGTAHSYTSIVDSDGAAVSGVTIDIINNYWGNSAWGNGAYNAGGQFNVNSSSTPYYDLLRSYFGGEPQTQITGLTPNAKYDLVVYAHTHDNRRISVNANGIENWGSNNLPGAPLVIGRDAFVFKGIAADDSGQILFYRQNGNEGVFSGFQLQTEGSNTVPTGTDRTVAIARNAFHTFASAEFGFTDPDPLDTFVKIKVTTLPADGALTLSGNPVLINQIIQLADLVNDNLVFTPEADASATGYASFQFKVNDGTVYSASANTMTLDVEPTATLVNVKFLRSSNNDAEYEGAAAIGSGDSQWNNLDLLTNSPSPSSLISSTGDATGLGIRFNGGIDMDSWGNGPYWTTSGDYGRYRVTSDDATYDLLRSYLNHANVTVYGMAPGVYDLYVYISATRENMQSSPQIWANGGGGGVMQASDPRANGSSAPLVVKRDYVKFSGLVVNATGELRIWSSNGEGLVGGFQLRSGVANVAPTGANKSFTIAQNAYQAFAATDFGFADADAGDLLQKVKVMELPAAGTLTLSGNPVLTNQQVTVADINAGKLRFTPVAGATSSPYTTFQFKVSDGVDYSAAAYTSTMNVVAQASLVNVKFFRSSNGDASYAGAGAVGSGSDQWNSLDMPVSDNVWAHRYDFPLVSSLGAATGVGLRSNVANWNMDSWGNGPYWTTSGNDGRYRVTSDDATYDLLRSYLDHANMIVYGLTPGAYDLYVYISATRENMQSSPQIWANGGGGNVMQASDPRANGSSAPLVVKRDYVKFPGLVVNATGELRIWSSNGEGLVGGFQLRAAVANVAPTGANNTMAIAQNAYKQFAAADFGFADADAGDLLQEINVTALPGAGTLTLSGTTVLANQIITVADINAGKLRFTPAAFATSSASYATIQFKVSDGVDFSASANTLTFDVDARASLVNVNFFNSETSPPGVGYSGAAAIGSGADQWNNLDVPASNGIYAQRYNSLLTSSAGTQTGVRLQFNAANWNISHPWGSGDYTTTSGDAVTNTDATYDLMRSYINNINLSLKGLTPGLYDFYVYSVANRNNLNQNSRFWVNGGTGGVMLPTTANLSGAPLVENRDYVSFKQVLVNADGELNLWWDNGGELLCGFQLAPTGTPTAMPALALSGTASGIYSFTTADFLSAGLDFGSSLATVQLTSLPANGVLKLNGTTIATVPVAISLLDIAAGKLTYVPASDGSGADYTFAAAVSNDGANYGPSGAVAFTVAPAPTPLLISAKYRHSNNGEPIYVGPALLGTGVPGVSGTQWNDIDDAGHNGTAHSYTSIVDSDGAAVLGVTIDIINNYWGNSNWGNGAYNAGGQFNVNSSSTPYYDLLRSYFGGEPRTQITGLTPNAKYDLVVYAHTRDNRRISVNANGIENWGSYNLPGAPLVIGRDAFVFKGIAADDSGQILFYRQNGDEGVFSGFQLQTEGSNTVPTGTDRTDAIATSTYKVLETSNFGFVDTDSLDSLVKVKVTSLPSDGVLTLSGNLALENQEVTAADISAGNLRFTSDSGFVGTTSFQFKVSDGTVYSVASNIMSFNVLAQASLIDVNFYQTARGESPYVGPAAIGTGTPGESGDQWNNLDIYVDAFPNYTPINDVNGNPTGVTVNFNTTPRNEDWGNSGYNTWEQFDVQDSVSIDSSSSYWSLLGSYIANPDVTANGLTPGAYDVFVYLNARVKQQMRISVNGMAKYGLFYQNGQGVQGSAPLVLDRDYILFKGVTVAADGKLRIYRDGGDECLMSGFQVRPSSAGVAPTAASPTVTMAMNFGHTFKASEFGFSDADAGDALQNVKITVLPTTGDLYLNGNPVLVNQLISADDLRSGLLVYQPATSGTGTEYSSFQFMVSDGASYSAAHSVTFDVLPQASLINVNFYQTARSELPYVGPGAIGAGVAGTSGDQWNNLNVYVDQYRHYTTIDASGNPTGVTCDFNTDPRNEDWGNSGYNTWGSWPIQDSIRIDSSSPYWNLLGSYIANPDVSLSGLTPGAYDVFVYLNARLPQQMRITVNNLTKYGIFHQNGSGVLGDNPLVIDRDYIKFAGVVVGSDGKLRMYRNGGGECLVSGMQVRPMISNTAPTAVNATVTMAKNTSHTLAASEFGFADADVGDTLQKIKVTAIPAAGNLYLTGWEGPVLQNQIITVNDLMSSKLSYQPTTGASGDAYASFQFLVSDGNDDSSAHSVTFNVLPQASLINVQFYQTSRSQLTYVGPAEKGTGVPGVSGSLWNSLDIKVGSYPNYTEITDAAGAPTGVSVNFNGNVNADENFGTNDYTTWGGPVVDSSSPYANLLRPYLRNPDLSVKGLTPGTYDLYLMINSRVNQQMGVNVNGVHYLSAAAGIAGDPLVEHRDVLPCKGVIVGADGVLRVYRNGGGEFTPSGFQLTPAFGAYFTASTTSGDAPLPVDFTDTSLDATGATITAWAWDFGDGTTSNLQNPSHTYSVWGTYQVRLTMTNSNDLSDTSKPTTITVSQPATFNVTSTELLQDTGVNTNGHTLTFAPATAGLAMFGGLTGNGDIALKDTANDCVTLLVGQNNANGNYSGVLSECGGLTKVGTGVFTLGGANLYGGATTIEDGTLRLSSTQATPGVNASYFAGFSGYEKLDLQGASYTPSLTRCFTGTQGLLGLTATTSIANYTGDMSGFSMLGVAGQGFYTGWSGTFTPQGSGDVTYTFYWNNDDRGAMFIDKDGDGVFQAGEQVGTNVWANGGAAVTLTAGTPYNFIYMTADGGGGYNNTWSLSGPGLSQRSPNASDPDQVGMWNIISPGGPGGEDILPAGTALHIANSGVLQLDGINSTVYTLYLNGSPMAAGTYGSTAATGAEHQDDTYFAGTGVLTVTTTGGGSTTYTVTYDGNGSTGTVPVDGSNPHASGSSVTVLGNTGPLTLVGYVFTGWTMASDGSGTSYTAGNTFNITGNTTLYAKWMDAYDAWATLKAPGASGFNDDPNNDGVANGFVWALGGNAADPLTNNTGILPHVAGSATTGLTVTFNRAEASIGNTTLTLQYASNLSGIWTDVIIDTPGGDHDHNGVTVTVVPGSPLDAISVNIPTNKSVAGKLFARVIASRP